MALVPCFVGLDIAKDHIEVSVRPTDDRRQAEQMYRLALAIDRRLYGAEGAQTRNDARVLNEFLKSAPR